MTIQSFLIHWQPNDLSFSGGKKSQHITQTQTEGQDNYSCLLLDRPQVNNLFAYGVIKMKLEGIKLFT